MKSPGGHSQRGASFSRNMITDVEGGFSGLYRAVWVVMRQMRCQVEQEDQTCHRHEWYRLSSPSLVRWDEEERCAPLTRSVFSHCFRYFWAKNCCRMGKRKEWIDALIPTLDVGIMGILSWSYIDLYVHRKLYSRSCRGWNFSRSGTDIASFCGIKVS